MIVNTKIKKKPTKTGFVYIGSILTVEVMFCWSGLTWEPLIITTKEAPQAVNPQVNRVPKKACITGEYPGNMLNRFRHLNCSKNEFKPRTRNWLPSDATTSIYYETCRVFCGRHARNPRGQNSNHCFFFGGSLLSLSWKELSCQIPAVNHSPGFWVLVCSVNTGFVWLRIFSHFTIVSELW